MAPTYIPTPSGIGESMNSWGLPASQPPIRPGMRQGFQRQQFGQQFDQNGFPIYGSVPASPIPAPAPVAVPPPPLLQPLNATAPAATVAVPAGGVPAGSVIPGATGNMATALTPLQSAAAAGQGPSNLTTAPTGPSRSVLEVAGDKAGGVGGGAAAPAGVKWTDAANSIVGAVGTAGNLYLGYQAYQQGMEEFEFQKNLATKNYANSLKAYNDAAEDRVRGKFSTDSRETEDAQVRKKQLDGKSTTSIR